jgi:dTDP-glucose 4,6-dehydratase
MTDNVMDRVPIRQMNDYAMTKWVNTRQILNLAEMCDTESMRVHLFNACGYGEYYSPYRSTPCVFMYRALHDAPYTVYTSHDRTSTYVTNAARTLASIVDNFIPSEVNSIGGSDYHDIKGVSNMILDHLGKNGSFVTYHQGEAHTTKDKKLGVGKTIRDLRHNSQVPLEEGILCTIG